MLIFSSSGWHVNGYTKAVKFISSANNPLFSFSFISIEGYLGNESVIGKGCDKDFI